MRRTLRAYVPALFWMVVMFVASSDIGSSQKTSRIIEPFLRWLYPGVSEHDIRLVQLVARKTAHLTEYGILAVLLWRGRLIHTTSARDKARRIDDVVFVLSVAVLFAISDEIHQAFVASRTNSSFDVLIDASGAAVALGLLFVFKYLHPPPLIRY